MQTFVSITLRVLEFVLIVVMGALVLDVLWGVASRFLLGAPSRWTEEVATFLLIWVSLLGAAVAFARDEHLGVEFLVKKFDPDIQRRIEIFVQILIVAFSCSALVFGGYVLVSETLGSGQVTPALGIKMGYVYLAVPISGILFVLFAIDRIRELLETPSAANAAKVEGS